MFIFPPQTIRMSNEHSPYSPAMAFLPNYRYLIILSFLCLISGVFKGQINDYPKDFFQSPLEIPLNLSGNFGELRTNHFHAGIDIKTEQREGLNVLAAAEGFVSRIKVSPVGYGYALYIDHPNGYTTVYGHLSKYAAKIDDYVKSQQYELESFSVDLYPERGLLPVIKGELVGLSGNSGSSGGPHLHFEIRETVTEKLVNPLLFGLQVKDKIPPSVSNVWIVPLTDSSWVNGARLPVALETRGGGLKTTILPKIYGDVGFAIATVDMLDGNSNRCGIYRIEFFVDGLQVYGQRMDRLDFATNRAMNAHTIYERFKKDRSSIHGSYRLPGNPLDIYDNLVNDGVISFRDGKTHVCEYRLLDIMGNETRVKFSVQAQTAPGKPATSKAHLAHWDWERDNNIETDRVKLSMKANTLYENLDLDISETTKIANSVGPAYLIASPYEPVHNAYTLALKADKVKPGYEKKTTVVRWDPDKNKLIAESSKYQNGWITAEPMYLGYFALMTDTVKPSISVVDFAPALRGKKSFSFKISDGLSGIDQIIPRIDGKWALMEYDAKTSRLTYYFDSRYISSGEHQFELTVIDAVGNDKQFNGRFTW
jgi:murein DD-endopeptidase MepM/ murein hydrolase activator NlpD